MKRFERKKVIDIIIKILCFTAIVIWPVYNSFLGLDLVDTGYYLYQYDTPLSPYGTYTTYLATLIGAVWLKVFPKLGLWGLNVLEIILEWITCFVVYRSFKDRFGSKTTMCGIAITMCGISTYVNIFNYHQLNMTLCCIMLCFMYQALIKEKNYLLFISGCLGALAVTCRMPSILTLVCVLCIFYWNILVEKNRKGLVKKFFLFLSGYVVVGICVALFLYVFQLTDIIIGELFRLNNLGSTSSAAYGTSSMLKNLIGDTFWGSLAALLFIFCILGFSFLYEWMQKKKGKRIIILVGYIFFMIPAIYIAIYKIGQAPSFIQLTSFSWFLYGMCFVISIYYMIRGIVSSTREAAEDGTVMLMAIALILLCIVGSAARAKHVILGLWFIVPFIGNKVKEVFYGIPFSNTIIIKNYPIEKFSKKTLQITTGIVILIGTICFGKFVLTTNNFDSTDRTMLTEKVDSDKVKYIRTTNREAEAINGVLNVLEGQKRELLVVGNGVGFYYLTGMESYVRPWVSGTSYTYDKLYGDLKERTWRKEKRPIILVCRTNPYEGFSYKNYDELKEKEEVNNHDGKKDLIFEFMDVYKYSKIYENDYFALYEPDSKKEMEIWELW